MGEQGLRDIDQNAWNADTLVILSSGVDDAALEQLARQWHADEMQWTSLMELSSLAAMLDTPTGQARVGERVLRLWWDSSPRVGGRSGRGCGASHCNRAPRGAPP